MTDRRSPSPAHRPTHRRPLLVALASGAAAVTGIGVAARTGVLSDPDEPGPGADGVLELSAAAAGVEELALPLGGRLLDEAGHGQWRSRPLSTTTYTMVGFTWRRGEKEPHIQFSARVGGVWQPWRRVPRPHHAPDPHTGEFTDTTGTELTWTGPADGIRVRVTRSRPDDFTMVLLHPTALPSDRAAAYDASGAVGRAAGLARVAWAATGSPLRPDYRTRAEWGANEDWRTSDPRYCRTIKQVHVHHTVNSNDYSRADVPALIRGMYRYHTYSLGWSDIGYNFLVDRFGRLWVGRAGGPRRPVRGAHTLGFNHSSTGVSVIGNFDVAAPPPEVIAAIVHLAAWKLHRYDRDPEGTIVVTSEGSDKYPDGTRVRLPVIDGHRDTNDTACPGRYLYEKLPAIRRRARRRIERFTS